MNKRAAGVDAPATKDTPMLKVAADETAGMDGRSSLDELCREGARRMLAAALEAEADAYVEAFAGEVDDADHRLVVRNGRARPRTITTVAGAIEVQTPRVN